MSKNKNNLKLNYLTLGTILSILAGSSIALLATLYSEKTNDIDFGYIATKHDNLDDFVSSGIRSAFYDGEEIDTKICHLSFDEKFESGTIMTKHGLRLKTSVPGEKESSIINSLPIYTIGKVDKTTAQLHAAMLRRVLPSVIDNPQFRLQVFSNPKLALAIIYEDTNTLGAFHDKTMTIFINYQMFHDEASLYSTLRNEFSSFNIAHASDCRYGIYDASVYRSVPFFAPKVESPQSNIELDKRVKAFFDNYAAFKKSKHTFMKMHFDTTKQNKWYRKYLSLLESFSPKPVSFEIPKPSISPSYEVDGDFHIYETGDNPNKRIKIWVLPETYKTTDTSVRFFGYREASPLTLKGKFIALATGIDERIDLINSAASYRDRHKYERYAELISFIEDLMPGPLLKFFFPDLCTELTEHAQLAQSYC